MAHNILEDLVHADDGVLRVSAATKLGVSAPTIYAFARSRGLQKMAKGIYADANGWHDEMWLTSLRWPRAVFSHHTALLAHSLTDRAPGTMTLTVPSGYNATALRKAGLQVFYIKPDLLEMGRTKVPTPDGHLVPCYDLERTICDVLRSRSHIDPQSLTAAMQGYVRRSDKQLAVLATYAQKLGIGGLVSQYLEVLL